MILLLCCSALVQAQSVVQIDSLTALPQSVQNDINQLCLPSQYRDGAEAYRRCVAREIEHRNSDGAKLMDNYSFDEKYAIQQSCGGSASSSNSYLECVRKEIQLLDAVPVPVLGNLNEEEKNALQLSCYEAQKYQGASNFRLCLNNALQNLLAIPRADLSHLSSIQRNEININCTNSSRQLGPSNYRLCIAEALADILKQQRDNRLASTVSSQDSIEEAAQTVSPAAINAAANSTADTRTGAGETLSISEVAAAGDDSLLVNTNNSSDSNSAISLSELQSPSVQITSLEPASDNSTPPVAGELSTVGDTIGIQSGGFQSGGFQSGGEKPATDTTDESVVENRAPAVATDRFDSDIALEQNAEQTKSAQPVAFIDNPLEYIKSLDTRNYSHYLKMMLPVLVILVSLRLLMLLLKRRKSATEPQEYQPVAFPDDQFELGSDDTMFGTSAGAQTPVSNISLGTAQSTGYDSLFNQGLGLDKPDDKASEFDFLDSPPEAAAEPEPEPAHSSGGSLLDQTLYTPVYRESEFGRWIHQQPEQEHKRLCTEFLLYWVSYGDGNYREQFKDELLRAVDLNEHDLIKKWVLEQNPSTLVDALQRIWSIFSKTEVEQTINMMFAVLVKHEISPVQNTFFRFLADFAHIGSEGLDRLHTEAFGSVLPPLPRPDDERWWKHQLANAQQQGGAAPLAEQSDRELCLSLLGLSEPSSAQQIKFAYAQIANRCDPERFDQLGKKEQGLVQRHLAKYTRAYEFLIEDEQ